MLTVRLHTAPLAATTEVTQLFTAGLVDKETALPAVLHVLGASTEETEAALRRSTERENERRGQEKEDREHLLKERAVALAATSAQSASVAKAPPSATASES